MPPLRQSGDHLKDFVRGVLGTGRAAPSIGPRDLFVIPDGMKAGLQKQLLGVFTQEDGSMLDKSVRTFHVHLDEETYFLRFDKIRGFNRNLVDQYHCITAQALDMPLHQRKYFPGTNRSNSLGSVACPPFLPQNHHMLQWKVKQ